MFNWNIFISESTLLSFPQLSQLNEISFKSLHHVWLINYMRKRILDWLTSQNVHSSWWLLTNIHWMRVSEITLDWKFLALIEMSCTVQLFSILIQLMVLICSSHILLRSVLLDIRKDKKLVLLLLTTVWSPMS